MKEGRESVIFRRSRAARQELGRGKTGKGEKKEKGGRTCNYPLANPTRSGKKGENTAPQMIPTLKSPSEGTRRGEEERKPN